MIELVIDQRPLDLGGGFRIGRVLPQPRRRMVGPFVFFDHIGPVDFAPGIPCELDVRPHPHIGLATVTYLYSGALTHRDSLGFHQEIRPEAVNWMTAGSGITHSERLEHARAHGAPMHGIQAWVALPEQDEEMAPGFSHHPAEGLPVWHEAGVTSRLIAGQSGGLDAGVPVRSPLCYLHWDMAPGARCAIPEEYSERAVFVAAGAIETGTNRLGAGQLAVLTPRAAVTITAREAATVMVFGGEAVGERFLFWNFVSSSRERIEQAKADWRAGRMRLPVGDDREFTPLPDG